MNISSMEECELVKNTFRKYVYTTGTHLSTLVVIVIQQVLLKQNFYKKAYICLYLTWLIGRKTHWIPAPPPLVPVPTTLYLNKSEMISQNHKRLIFTVTGECAPLH
jgi:hypothetical protein